MRMAMIALLLVAGCSSDHEVSRELGARCDATSDCDERCLPPDNDYPGGFCTVSCITTNECPGSSSCADREGGICLFDCFDDRDCTFLGDGWTCKDTNAREQEGLKVKVCRGD
jgi:hypothetical protein